MVDPGRGVVDGGKAAVGLHPEIVIGEDDPLDAVEQVGAVRRSAAIVHDLDDSGAGQGDRIVAPVAAIDGVVGAALAVNLVVAGAAGEGVASGRAPEVV